MSKVKELNTPLLGGLGKYRYPEKNLLLSRIVGGLVWPSSENTGAAVVVAEESSIRPPRMLHVLAEVEDANMGELITKVSTLVWDLCANTFYGRRDQVASRYLGQWNSEARKKRMAQFFFSPAPSSDLPIEYHYSILRDRLNQKTVQFFEGSQLPGLILSVGPNQRLHNDLEYPFVSALAFAVSALTVWEPTTEVYTHTVDDGRGLFWRDRK